MEEDGYPVLVQKQSGVMRELLVLIFMAIMVLPSSAAKRMTVAQLEQTLNADRTAHKQDAEIARQILSIELGERLTETTLDRLSEQFVGSSPAASALLLLADKSAFLDPPPGELPASPVPDDATQQHLINAARRFAGETLPRLPNLLATRTTFNFDDRPQEVTKGGYLQRMGMHLVGTSKAEVSVRNEGQNPSPGVGPAPSQAQGGLITWGEFGSTLLIVLSDAAQGEIAWSHWEQTPSGPVAVFHYAVPKAASHYEIDTPIQQIQTNGGSNRWARTGGPSATTVGANTKLLRSKPGYQGSLWVDPATGNILRVSLVADLRGNPRFEHGAILVEYAPVQIADKTFICPVRSLALSSAPPNVDTTLEGATTEWLNENLFTGYHMFASTSRILSESAPDSEPMPAPSSAGAKQGNAAGEQTVQQAPVAGAPLTQPAEQSSAASQPPQPAPPITLQGEKVEMPQSSAPVVGTEAPVANDLSANAPSLEPSARPAPGSNPGESPSTRSVGQTVPPPDSGSTLHVNVNAVLVPVVVRDKQGRAIGSLNQADFTVLDQGSPRAVTGFTLVKSVSEVYLQKATEPGSVGAPMASSPAAAQNRFIVFLFDDRHLNSSDLAITQKAAAKMLDQPLGPADYADVLSFMGVNSGFTRDRGALQAAIMKLTVHQANQHVKEDCPDIDYYAADRIVNQHDQVELGIAVRKARDCTAIEVFEPGGSSSSIYERIAVSAATHAIAVGEEDARESLLSVETVVRAMSKLPAQRTLILVSPGFLSLSPEAMNFKSRVLNEAAGANVVINVLDARGLYTGNVDASQGPNSTVDQFTGQTSNDHFASIQESENAMAELANGTGGTFFHNSNDLEGGLRSLAAAPEYLYLLEISATDVKPTGAYHRLQVKVDQPGVQVQARRGYFAPKYAKSEK